MGDRRCRSEITIISFAYSNYAEYDKFVFSFVYSLFVRDGINSSRASFARLAFNPFAPKFILLRDEFVLSSKGDYFFILF